MIKQIGLLPRGRPILLITRMITDRIGLHSVLLPLQIGVVSEIISATQSESEESERFHFFRLRLRLRRLRSAYDLVKTRLWESEAGGEG